MNLAKDGVLTLAAMDLDGRPMFWSESGRRLGYEPEVAAAVATRLGLRTARVPGDIRDAVDRELRELIADGELAQIGERWFPHRSLSV